jgi:hypothetical protein
MRITRKIAIPLITGAALLGTAGIAYAGVTPTPIDPTNPFPTPTATQPFNPINPVNPTPNPIRNRQRCIVEFDILRIPTINPFTGQRVRAGQWDRVCFSRFGGVTVTPLTNPIVF